MDGILGNFEIVQILTKFRGFLVLGFWVIGGGAENRVNLGQKRGCTGSGEFSGMWIWVKFRLILGGLK